MRAVTCSRVRTDLARHRHKSLLASGSLLVCVSCKSSPHRTADLQPYSGSTVRPRKYQINSWRSWSGSSEGQGRQAQSIRAWHISDFTTNALHFRSLEHANRQRKKPRPCNMNSSTLSVGIVQSDAYMKPDVGPRNKVSHQCLATTRASPKEPYSRVYMQKKLAYSEACCERASRPARRTAPRISAASGTMTKRPMTSVTIMLLMPWSTT